MIDWGENLLDDFARRRAVLVVGSGVSNHAVGTGGLRPPDWRTFLERAVAECPGGDTDEINKALAAGDFLHACEWLKKRFDERWTPYLRKTFQAPRFQPSELHKLLIRLDQRIIFSLDFDDLIERAAKDTHQGSEIVKRYHDEDVEEFLRGNGRYIVKVHGSLNTPNQLIFTQNEYSSARVVHSSFYQAFDACLLTHSFVFIGAGYSDPDVNLILENQAFSFPSKMPHYFVTSAGLPDDRKDSLRKNRNLKVLEYDKVDDHHSGLVKEIENLADQLDNLRFDMSISENW